MYDVMPVFCSLWLSFCIWNDINITKIRSVGTSQTMNENKRYRSFTFAEDLEVLLVQKTGKSGEKFVQQNPALVYLWRILDHKFFVAYVNKR